MKLDKLKYEMALIHPACFVRKIVYLNGGIQCQFQICNG